MSNSSLVTYTCLVSNKTNGRGGKKIEKIFVHHMAGNLTVKQCGNVFKSRAASAHYGVNGSQIGQYVDESNTAWHCGNFAWNQKSIGIELANDGGASSNWHVADSTIETAIKLIADICKRNGITKLIYTGDMSGNLCMHKWVASTSCPGAYLATQFSRIAEGVNKLISYDPEKAAKLEAIIRKSQKFFGTPEDGTISGQLYEYNKNFPALVYAVDSWDGEGSDLIEALQKWLEVEEDGLLGPETVKAWQEKIGVTVDSKFGSKSLTAWEAYLAANMKEADPEPAKDEEEAREILYRVRKSWNDAKSQVGAYKNLENAKKAADKNGLNVYGENGKLVYQGKKKEPTNAEKIINKAKALAGSAGTPTTAYKNALNKAYPNRSKWGEGPRLGRSCDVFVAVVVKSLGFDSSMPRGLRDQLTHKPNSKYFTRTVKNNVAPYDYTKAGDLIFYNGSKGHACIRTATGIYEANYSSKKYPHFTEGFSKLQKKRDKVVIWRAK